MFYRIVLFFIFALFLFSCSSNKDKKCTKKCNIWESCKIVNDSQTCVLNDGKCNSNEDCKDEKKNHCNESNTCVPFVCDEENPCKDNLTCYKSQCYDFSENKFENMDMLDFASSFKFYIMSDNKGEAEEKVSFKKMIEWTKDRDQKFVIGLGDHLKKGRDNLFLDFIENNEFYKNNFYPNIADGENEYYGEGQDDWGAGGKFLELFDFENKDNVTLRDNKAEYYASIKIGDITIHLIQVHFPDEPRDDAKLAWPQESRDYLINKLKSIEKTKNDIVIVGAHSIFGSWHNYLKKEELDIVLEKVDLGLSATVHEFAKMTASGHDNDATLFINTGAITHGLTSDGYLEVHFIKNPNRIIIQYIDMKKSSLEINKKTSWIKYINGKIEKL